MKFRLPLFFSALVFAITATPAFSATKDNHHCAPTSLTQVARALPTKAAYLNFFSHHEVSFNAYKKAINAYNATKEKNPDRLILIDYSKSSSKKRFFVLDMNSKRIEYSTYVAHAKNSGWRYASHFSNKVNSSESAIGRFKTADNTYYGKNGISLRVIGLDKGVNNNTLKRNIVIHGSFYVGVKWMRKHNGFQGRSLGCFAIPHSIYKEIIPKIKNGVVVYVYK